MKRKQRQKLAYAGIAAGVVVFIVGAVLVNTLGPEPSMSAADWFERASARDAREFHAWVLMGGAAFAIFVAVSELIRQAKKLKS